MKRKLADRLLHREFGDLQSETSIRGIYGDGQFVKDLDIVNELKGHTGCVNALSWSNTGKILASGSDDRVINLFSYQPSEGTQQFKLASSIDTGHTRNIFSVKFMPHSGDRTIVSCAGDAQVRVFDIERAAVLGGDLRHMSSTSTKGKCFRSHTQSVKRIVTEASPFYFLTCSEDGNIRQWDVRQPESTYPRPRRASDDDRTPPPLISYRDYNIDIYSMSCSPSQPHYIAVGGTHLHCFLHDRRMLGRDRIRERGGPTSSRVASMMEATRCVRKFAPHGQPSMGRSQSAQITACKISNYNPNELVASWSADSIYSFDMHRDLDADTNKVYGIKDRQAQTQKDRKRKRTTGSGSSGKTATSPPAQSSFQTPATNDQRSEPVSLLVRLRNGESIEIPIGNDTEAGVQAAPPQPSGIEAQAHSLRIAQGVSGLKREMFVGHSANGEHVYYKTDDALEDREDAMVKVLCEASGVFEMIDDAISRWAFPTTTSSSAVAFQQKLRDDRAKAWRFVQAAGTMARVLLKMSPANNDRELPKALDYFDIVRFAPREASRPLAHQEQFCYDFIKAVLLWVDSGVGAVIQGFTFDGNSPNRHKKRQPILEDSELDGDDIQDALIPYLRRLASNNPINDVDPDEDGDTSIIYSTEKDAVAALGRAMMLPFEDLMSGVNVSSDDQRDGDSVSTTSQKRETAISFWVQRVCRSLLRTAAVDVDFSFVDTAFDGLDASDNCLATVARDPTTSSQTTRLSTEYTSSTSRSRAEAQESEHEQGEDMNTEDDYETVDEDDSDHEGDDVEVEVEEESSDEDYYMSINRPIAKTRMRAASNVPCTTHTNSYSGHCNIETTKDVNYYGLQDEYIVSGSDDGNLFIWDKKTAKLINILEGDGEVVNVIQPHPYEPMLAVSGIDHTVKIFSPDGRLRREAAGGISAQRSDASRFSSIGRGRQFQPAPQVVGDGDNSNATGRSGDESQALDTDVDTTPELSIFSAGTGSLYKSSSLLDDSDAEDTVAVNGLASMKRMSNAAEITNRNNDQRRRGGGNQWITRGMMALMQRRFRAQLGAMGVDVRVGGDGQAGEDGEDGEETELDGDCTVM